MLSQIAPLVSPAIVATPERFAFLPASLLKALNASVSHGAFVVYAMLATFADRSGHCWPGRATLAEMTGFDVEYISRLTGELERAGFLRKRYRPDGRVDYYLLVVPVDGGASPRGKTSTPPVEEFPPLTENGTPQETERAREPEPEPPPPPAREPEPEPPALSVCRLQARTALSDDWQAPDEWIEWAGQQRPELASTLGEIAENFADYHRSRGTRSACWTAEWRRWIRRERAPRSPVGAPQGAQSPKATDRRYPTPEQEKAPLPAAVQAAIEASHRRFQEQCRQMGIDPATGAPTARADQRGDDSRPSR